MRIALIAHSNSPWTPYYARFFRERGHEVQVVSFFPQPIEAGTFHYVGVRPPDGRLPKWIYIRRTLEVGRLLRRIRPDVTLATYVRSNGLLGALTKCSPLVISTRGVDIDFGLPFGLGRTVTRWVASRAELLHASSPELAEDLEALGVEPGRITVIPVGTDAAVFHPRFDARLPGPARIICTRKHEPLYDNSTVVRALGRLRDRGVAFEARFVGSGSTLEQTRREVSLRSLDACVAVLGEAEHDAVPGHLRWADVYVSGARSDGAPSSLFEAMSCRLYPVVTDVRANRDWIVSGKNGRLFRVGDEESCAEALAFACGHLGALEDVLTYNRTLVTEKLDRAANLVRLEDLLVRAAAGARPRR